MASSGTQRNIQFTISAAQAPADAVMALEEKEAKSPDASVANAGIFSRNSLQALCMEKRLSAEHKLGEADQKLPPALDSLYMLFKQEKLKQLLEAILHGDPKTVEEMIESYPILLLEKLNEKDFVTAPSGHKANGTPYQLALAVEDTQMAALLKAELIEVADEQEAEKQFTEQFPKGWEEEEEKKSAPIFAQLDILTLAIRNAEAGDIISSGDPDYRLTVREGSAVAVAIALAQFRSLLDATLEETITTGRHFNPKLLLRAFEIYDAHYEDYFGNDYSNPKAMLFWQQAIGYVQRFMPTNYAQAFCNGLEHTKNELQANTPQCRSLKFEKYHAGSWVPTDFYPLPVSRLGFDFAVYGRGRGAAVGVGASRRGRVSELMSIKNSRITELLLSSKIVDVRRQNRVAL